MYRRRHSGKRSRRRIRSFTNPVIIRRRASERSRTRLFESSLAEAVTARSHPLIERTTILLPGGATSRDMLLKLIEDFSRTSFRHAIEIMV